MANRSGPLEGVTMVLDFRTCPRRPLRDGLMADLGADVIKVEAPGGDEYRHVGPRSATANALFQNVNRGKRSDRAGPEGAG